MEVHWTLPCWGPLACQWVLCHSRMHWWLLPIPSIARRNSPWQGAHHPTTIREKRENIHTTLSIFSLFSQSLSSLLIIQKGSNTWGNSRNTVSRFPPLRKYGCGFTISPALYLMAATLPAPKPMLPWVNVGPSSTTNTRLPTIYVRSREMLTQIFGHGDTYTL